MKCSIVQPKATTKKPIERATRPKMGRNQGPAFEPSSKRDLRPAANTESRQHRTSSARCTSNSCHLLNRFTCSRAAVLGCALQATLLIGLMTTTSTAQRDVMPQQYQHNNILSFSVEENRPNGTYVDTIRSSDGQVPYLVVPSPQTPESELKSAFNINYTTGDVTTNSMLDREHREQYHFIAIVREPFAEIKCTVTVKDANDNAPMFLTPASNETTFVIDIPEGSRGVRKVLPLAIDFDTPQYGIKEFRIISGNTPSGTFHLVEHEAPARSTLLQNSNLGTVADDMLAAGADNPQLIQQLTQQATVLIPSQPSVQTSIHSQQSQFVGANSVGGASAMGASQQSKFLIDLEVSQPLDRENQSSYQLVVEAIDGGQPPLFGRLLVTVNVQDVNDNDPIFLRKYYECHINEDMPKGSLVHRVQAYDVDLDSNGQVSYYIKRHTSSSQQQNNANSSESNNEVITTRHGVSAVGKPRTQQGQNVATSTGSKSANGARNVNTDSQDPSFGGKTRSAYNPDQIFEIDPSKGEIYLANQLDFETDQLHELLVEARDHGKPYRSTYTTVKVYVQDVPDDPPVTTRAVEDRRAPGESKAESSARSSGSELMEPVSQQNFNFNNINFASLFAQLNSSMLFVIIFVAIVAVAFPVCLIKIKSRQPESDYNDTAGLTLASNNGQAKPSPNHSSSNLEHPNGMMGDNMIHRHHDHQRRNGSFGGLSGSGPFGAPNGKMNRYPYSDSSNLYHNPYPPQQRARHHSSTSGHHMVPDSPNDHQMAGHGHGQGASRGGTMTLMSHHHHPMLAHTPPGHHHLMDHHHHPFSPNHGTSSLTYAHHHSRAALLQHAHHHQSSHQLSSMHQAMNGLSKGGTMNSVGTHHSAQQPSSSPLPAMPNTTHSSGLPPNMHDGMHLSHHNSLLPSIPQSHQVCQLPPTPNHNVNQGSMFTWPPQGHDSASGCYPGPNGTLHEEAPGSTMDSCSTQAGPTTPQPLDRWFDLSVAPQLVNPRDWCGSYNWDYLEDWTPEYHTLMPIIETNASGSGY